MISNLFLLFFAEKGMAVLCLFHFFIFSGFLSKISKKTPASTGGRGCHLTKSKDISFLEEMPFCVVS